MLKLFQPMGVPGLPNMSPACMKLETWLRITEIPYETAFFDASKAPKGKIPYIEMNGSLIGDSTLIIEILKKEYGKDPDQPLSPVERAISLAFRRLLKENFFWTLMQARWFTESNWSEFQRLLRPAFPVEIAPETYRQIMEDFRKLYATQMYGHGIGRHTAEEIFQIGIADLRAVADFLADKPYFMGDRPSSADATVYAYIANLIEIPLASPALDFALTQKNLVDYCHRMRARFFPDFMPRQGSG